ncbi:MAG: stalk domain-containing protein [Bacillota bacterium]
MIGGFTLVLLLLAILAGGVGAEEVRIIQYPESNYQPGPGWPEGWTPPPVPAELPEWQREEVEQLLKDRPEYTRFEVRVQEPMPRWTQEYPYEWWTDLVACGETIYVFWYPDLDQNLIYETWERTFVSGKRSNDPCAFYPVRYIVESIAPSPEQQEAEAQGMEFQYRVDKSNDPLGQNHGAYDNGSPDSIFVYLNDGFASYHFDVPAYLDTTVNRVRVPIRFISEYMGAEVHWEESTQQVTIRFPAVDQQVRKAVPMEGFTYEDLWKPEAYYPDHYKFRMEDATVTLPARTLVLTIGQPRALVNGEEVPLDAPPVVRDGRTMVPVRFVAEQMGAKVYWVGDQPIFRTVEGTLSGTYHVHIYTPLFPLFEYPSWYMENRAQRF